MDEKLKLKVVDAYKFLSSHPALSGGTLDGISALWWYPVKCCKRGIAQSSSDRLSTHYDDPYRSGRWEDEFRADYTEEALSSHPGMCVIHKTYDEVFGEPWAFDHVEFWFEITFTVFQGGIEDSKAWMDQKRWGRYQGPEGGARTFEEMLVAAAQAVKEELGNFQESDFYMPEELANHAKENPWISRKLDKKELNPITGKEEHFFAMDDNPAYIDVGCHVLNRRWLRWYIETDICKRNWGASFNLVAHGGYSDSWMDSSSDEELSATKEEQELAKKRLAKAEAEKPPPFDDELQEPATEE